MTHLFSDLTDDLVKLGHEVIVVANKANRGLDEQTRLSYEQKLDEKLPNGVRVLRVGPSGREKGSLVSRGLRFIKATDAVYQRAAALPADVYLVNSMPPFLGLAGAKLAAKAPSVFILQDLFPDSVIAMGKLPKSGPVTAALRKMEKISLFQNTRLVTISNDMKNTLLEKGVPEDKIDVVPNWADTSAVRPVPRAENRLFSELGLAQDTFYAVYAGALGLLQTPHVILDAAKLMQNGNENIKFIIFGSGGLEAALRARIESEGIANVLLFPAQDVARVPEVYGVGDVSLVTLKAGVTKIAMPSKTWTAMAAGRPVIACCDSGSEYASRVLAAGCTAVPPENAEALKDAVLSAYARRENLPAEGERARAYVETALSRKASTEDYELALLKAAQREQ